MKYYSTKTERFFDDEEAKKFVESLRDRGIKYILDFEVFNDGAEYNDSGVDYYCWVVTYLTD